jgi:23S rRNA (guanosine2251-2'-O)-methyltransferase
VRRRGRQRAESPGDLPKGLIFGVNPVLEGLRGSRAPLRSVLAVSGLRSVAPIVAEARRLGVRVDLTDHDSLDRLTQYGNHQGVAAWTAPFSYASLDELVGERPPLLVAIDGITDPQNLGAIMRSAEVLGAGGMLLPRDRVASVGAAVVRASAGAGLHLPVAQVVNLARALATLKDAGYWIVGLDPEGNQRFQELPELERAVLVIGSEGKGTRRLVAEHCDFRVVIPVRGRVASLNASVAAGIGIHELANRMPPLSKG